jgi:hypothetical protein
MEVDPAIALPLGEPAGELLNWRAEVANPGAERAARVRALAERWAKAARQHVGTDPALAAACDAHATALLDVLDGR